MGESVIPPMGAAADASKPSSSLWLYGPIPDLLFGCGLFYICIFIFLGAAGPGIMQVLPLGALPLIVILTSTPHYGATLLRVYEHRENRRKYAFFAVGITALLGGAFVFSLFNYLLGSILVTLYFNWNSWHYAGQNYGLAVMFLRRRGVGVEPLAKKLLYASFILSSALTIVSINFDATSAIYGPNSTAGATNLFGPLYHFISLRLPAQITTPLLAVGLTAYLGCLVAAFTMLGRKGSLSDLIPALILVVTQSFWFVIPLSARYWNLFGDFFPLSSYSSEYIFIFIAACHALQYLWVTSYFAKKTESYPGAAIYWLRCLLAGAALWNLPALALIPLAMGTVAYTEGLFFLIAAIVNLHHFILDGAIWKLRDDGIGGVLLRQPAPIKPEDAVAFDTSARGRPWGWAVLAVLGSIGVAVHVTAAWENEFGFRQARARGDLARMESAVQRLDWIGRSAIIHHRVLAEAARENGDNDRALSELDQGLVIRDHPRSHYEKGMIYEDQGDWNAAADAYERAYALNPNPVTLTVRLANSLIAAKRFERAKQVLEAGLTSHPDHIVFAGLLRKSKAALAAH